MSLFDEIRKKPPQTRKKILVIIVAIASIFVVVLWGYSVKQAFTKDQFQGESEYKKIFNTIRSDFQNTELENPLKELEKVRDQSIEEQIHEDKAPPQDNLNTSNTSDGWPTTLSQ